MVRTFRFGVAPTLYAPEGSGAAAVADPPPAAAAPTPPAAAATPPAAEPPATTPPAAASAPPPSPEPAAAAAVPEKYALTLPEGGPFAPEHLPEFEAHSRAIGLTNDQAQKLLATQAATITAQKTQWLADAKADPEIGGAKFDESLELAKKGVDWAFPEGSKGAQFFVQNVTRYGLGTHPELLRFFARLGRALREDRPPTTGRATAPAAETRLADQMFPSTVARS